MPKAAITFARKVCVTITDSHSLKIAQQSNCWVYYMYAFPMRLHTGVHFVSLSERFLTDDGQLMHRFWLVNMHTLNSNFAKNARIHYILTDL